jgi:hypothetical protein
MALLEGLSKSHLVERGYADARVLDGLLRAFIDGSQNIGTIVSRLLSAEVLMQNDRALWTQIRTIGCRATTSLAQKVSRAHSLSR